MQKPKVMTSILLAITTAAVIFVQPPILAQAGAPPTPPSHATQIFVTNAQLDPNEGFQVIRAFVRTGTLNQNCQVTMGDTNFVANGTIVFCAPRQPVGLGKGVLVSVFYPLPPSAGLTLSMTLLQDGARTYDAPVLCNVDGC
jgi:hypothetical protein